MIYGLLKKFNYNLLIKFRRGRIIKIYSPSLIVKMIILRQKEYGLKDIRKKIAEKLRNSIEKDKQAASKSHIKAIVSRRGVD